MKTPGAAFGARFATAAEGRMVAATPVAALQMHMQFCGVAGVVVAADGWTVVPFPAAGRLGLGPAQQFPTGDAAFGDEFDTSFPGFGNSRSLEATELQPLPTFALKTSGYEPSPEPPLPVIVTDAQFMYISRLPMLLNHVLPFTTVH
jgi:hypothetical protein